MATKSKKTVKSTKITKHAKTIKRVVKTHIVNPKSHFSALAILGVAISVYGSYGLVWNSSATSAPTEICTWPKGSMSDYKIAANKKYTYYGYSNTVKKGSYWWPESSYYQTTSSRIWHPIIAGSTVKYWRNAHPRTISLVNSVAYYFQKNNGIRFAVGDAYSEQHSNHTTYDVDLYADTISGALFQKVRDFSKGKPGSLKNNPYHNQTKTINLAKELIKTGKVDYIIYSNSDVVKAVQNWAKSSGYTYKSKSGNNIIQTDSSKDHYDHFHVRVRSDKTFCGR